MFTIILDIRKKKEFFEHFKKKEKNILNISLEKMKYEIKAKNNRCKILVHHLCPIK